MSDAQTEKKPTNWIVIVAPVLTALWMVWFYDRELRIEDKNLVIKYLQEENAKKDVVIQGKDREIKYWVNESIIANRQIPQTLDTLKARIKNIKP